MKYTDVRRLVDEWTERLRLGEYNIRVYIKDIDTIVSECGNMAYGFCESSTVHLEAEVTFLDIKDPLWMENGLMWNGRDLSLAERVEEVIVHELCHIFFENGRDQDTIKIEEGAVVRLSKALIALKYTDPPTSRKPKNKRSISDRVKQLRISDTLYPTTTNLKKER